MTTNDESLAAFFVQDHRNCDAGWAEVESAADAGDAAATQSAWKRFDTALRTHLQMEEDVLFPAFEAATGMIAGPTQVMRMEHQQMRGVLGQMSAALAGGDLQELLDQGDTLHLLIQQHNMKEEGILYPASERSLGGGWTQIRAALAPYLAERTA
jgi:iron-sulfur cluster repair protein YtfE (RIC family)